MFRAPVQTHGLWAQRTNTGCPLAQFLGVSALGSISALGSNVLERVQFLAASILTLTLKHGAPSLPLLYTCTCGSTHTTCYILPRLL